MWLKFSFLKAGIISSFLLFVFLLNVRAENPKETNILFPKGDLHLNRFTNLYFIDSTNNLSFEKISTQSKFKKMNQEVANFGLNPATIWLRLILKNNSPGNHYFLDLENPNLDEVSLFYNNKYKTDSIIISNKRPFTNRALFHQNFLFEVGIKKYTQDTFYLRVRSLKPLIIPIFWGTRDAIIQYLSIQEVIFGIYIGLILVMFFYNLFLFISIKDNSYLYFCIYVLTVGLTQSGLLGYNFRFLWPNQPWIEIHSGSIIPALVGIASIFFIREFLNTKTLKPFVDRILTISLLVCALVIILNLFNFLFLSQILVQINALIVSVIVLIISIQMAAKGIRKAIFFVAAWTLFLIGICLFVLANFNILAYTIFSKYILVLGSGFSITLLSFALADNINVLKKEKEESQAQALLELARNEALIKDQNVLLEKRVEERTKQLRFTMEDLNSTMDELKSTQSQLVESEKMASLGQLTAGIAHEINNPINFVTSNINPLKRDIDDVYYLVDKMEETIQKMDDMDIEKFQNLKKELDIDFVKDEINLLLKGIEEGAFRTSEIIRGLKNFARVDEQDLKEVNLNEGIDSTLLLLRNKTKGDIDIQLDLQDIPLVHCYAGKMNQVFMNIISNSIYALNEYYQNKPGGVLFIQTTKKGQDQVQIRIKDNGPGIPVDIQKKIFEPFFTTKPVGEGTGLGLSIVHTIIESHQGEIVLTSSPESGTEFLIIMPITH